MKDVEAGYGLGVSRVGMKGGPGGGDWREPLLHLLSHLIAVTKRKRPERNVTKQNGQLQVWYCIVKFFETKHKTEKKFKSTEVSFYSPYWKLTTKDNH